MGVSSRARRQQRKLGTTIRAAATTPSKPPLKDLRTRRGRGSTGAGVSSRAGRQNLTVLRGHNSQAPSATCPSCLPLIRSSPFASPSVAPHPPLLPKSIAHDPTTDAQAAPAVFCARAQQHLHSLGPVPWPSDPPTPYPNASPTTQHPLFSHHPPLLCRDRRSNSIH